MNMTLTRQVPELETYSWTYQVAGFFLALSILLSGSHIYASEICFIIFSFLCFSQFRFKLHFIFIGLVFLSFWFFFSLLIEPSITEVVFIILLLLLPSIRLSKQKQLINGVMKGIILILSFYAIYALLELFLRIMSPELAEIINPCLYGIEPNIDSTANSCYLPPYIINDFPLSRLYGLAGEPSWYGLTHVALLSLVISSAKPMVSFRFLLIQVISILLTLSITAIGLLVIMFGLMRLRKMNLYERNQTKSSGTMLKILIIILTFIFFALLVDGLVDAVVGRTYGRIISVFSSGDISAHLRTSATWLPVIDFFTNAPANETMFGMGKAKYIDYLEDYSSYTFIDGNLVSFSGQRGSIFSTLLLVFGGVAVSMLIMMLVILDRFRFSVVMCVTFGFLFLHTVALSFSTLAAIFLINLNIKNSKV